MSSFVMAVQYNYKAGQIQLRLAKTLHILGLRANIAAKLRQTAKNQLIYTCKTPYPIYL